MLDWWQEQYEYYYRGSEALNTIPQILLCDLNKIGFDIINLNSYLLMKNKFIFSVTVFYYNKKEKKTNDSYCTMDIDFEIKEINKKNEFNEYMRRHINYNINIVNDKILNINITITNELGIQYNDAYCIQLIVYMHQKKTNIFKEINTHIKKIDPLYWEVEMELNKKNKEKLKRFMENFNRSLFKQEEILEVLRGNKWLKGYSPPYDY